MFACALRSATLPRTSLRPSRLAYACVRVRRSSWRPPLLVPDSVVGLEDLEDSHQPVRRGERLLEVVELVVEVPDHLAADAVVRSRCGCGIRG